MESNGAVCECGNNNSFSINCKGFLSGLAKLDSQGLEGLKLFKLNILPKAPEP
jgi:hypothetical protein